MINISQLLWRPFLASFESRFDKKPHYVALVILLWSVPTADISKVFAVRLKLFNLTETANNTILIPSNADADPPIRPNRPK